MIEELEATIITVEEYAAATELAAVAADGATSIEVVDIDELDFDGGTLTIGEEVIAYTIDEATEEITLATAIANGPYPIEEPVAVYPPSIERYAYVRAGDDDEELEARVPLSLFDRLPLGPRDETAETPELVLVGLEDEEWVLVDVLAQEPVIDGSFIDPATAPGVVEVPLLDNFDRADATPPSAEWIQPTAPSYDFADAAPLRLVANEILGPVATYEGSGFDRAIALPVVFAHRITKLDQGSNYADIYIDVFDYPADDDARLDVGVEPRAWYAGGEGHVLTLYELDSANAIVNSAFGTAAIEVGDEVAIAYNGVTIEGWYRKPGGRWTRELELTATRDVLGPVMAAVSLGSGPGTGQAAVDDFRGGRGYFTEGGVFTPVALTDGLAPESSPTPTITGGPGYLLAEWAEIANPDFTTYEVHVSATTGFTPSSSTLIAETPGLAAVISSLGDGGELVPGTTYYVKVIAKDADGAGPASAQGSGTPLEISIDLIGPIDFGDLTGELDTATQLADGAIEAAKLDVSIGGGNLFPNSSAESATSDDFANVFTLDGTGALTSEAAAGLGFPAVHGDRVFKKVVASSGGFTYFYFPTGWPAKQGDKWVGSMYARAADAGQQARIWIQELNSGGAGLTANYGPWVNLSTTEWTRIIVPATLSHPDTVAVRPILDFNGDAPGRIFYADAVQFERGDVATAYAPRPDEILDNTITATEIADNAVTTPKLIANAVVAAKVATNTLTANEIAANAITADELAANAVIAGKIAAGTIVAGDIAANTLTADQIAANAITASELAANSITAADILANTITANEIAANTITAAQIAAGTITATELAAGSVTASEIAAGAIDAFTITGATIRTASANPRLELDATDLSVFASGGTEEIRLNAADGLVLRDSSSSGGTLSRSISFGNSDYFAGTGLNAGGRAASLFVYDDSGNEELWAQIGPGTSPNWLGQLFPIITEAAESGFYQLPSNARPSQREAQRGSTGITVGSGTPSADSSAISHNLHTTPTAVIATARADAGVGSGKIVVTTKSIGASTFILTVRTGDNTNIGSGTVTVDWIAIT